MVGVPSSTGHITVVPPVGCQLLLGAHVCYLHTTHLAVGGGCGGRVGWGEGVCREEGRALCIQVHIMVTSCYLYVHILF